MGGLELNGFWQGRRWNLGRGFVRRLAAGGDFLESGHTCSRIRVQLQSGLGRNLVGMGVLCAQN